MKVMEPTIRWCVLKHDTPDVLRIDQACYPPGARLTEDDLAMLCRRHIVVVSQNERDRITGYCAYSLADDHYQILRLAVAPAFRRCGFATAMLDRLLGRMFSPGYDRTRIVALVDGKQLAAQMFFSRLTFKAETVPDTDTMLFEYRVEELVDWRNCDD